MSKIVLKNYQKITIFLFVVAFLVRIIGLGSLGSGFFRDEAALGYNAYSIIKTAHDEFGKTLPIIFRSFEVFFLPLYVYLSGLFVFFLGLSPLSTRLLSALSGFFIVLVGFFISKEIKGKGRQENLLSLLFLALSPWAIFYSRGAFEGNLALLLFSVGALLFIRYGQKKTKSIKWALVFMTLSMYAYQAERLVVPLFVGLVLLIIRKDWQRGKLTLFKEFAPALILGIPLLIIWFLPAGLHRAEGVSLLKAGLVPGLDLTSAFSLFKNNPFYLVTNKIFAMYVHYFSPRNLFFELDYDNQRHLVGQATLFFWLAPGFFFGLYRGFVSWQKEAGIKILLIWLFLAPIPAALTADPFHTYRALLIFLPVTLISAWGTWEIFLLFRKSLLKKVAIFLFALLLLFSSIRLFSSYLFVNPYLRAKDWDYPMRKAAFLVSGYQGDYEKIVWDTSYSEPYIHYLYFSKYDPSELQKITSELDLDYYKDIEKIRFQNLENIYFEEVDWPTRRGDKGTLFVVPETKVPPSEFATDPNIEEIDKVALPAGEVFFRLLFIK